MYVRAKDVVRDAARRLLASPRVLIVAGRGAHNSAAELIALSELLDAPVATTMPGRGSVPDSYHLFIGGLGSSGHRAANDALRTADLVLALGCSSRGALFEVSRPSYTIRVDCDASKLVGSPFNGLSLHGDVKLTLASLLARLHEEPLQRYRKHQSQQLRQLFAEENRRAFAGWLCTARRARPRRASIQPTEICHTLERALSGSNRAVITVDVGVTTLWAYRHLIGDYDRIWTSSFGTMGFAVPAAIAVAERGQQGGPIIAPRQRSWLSAGNREFRIATTRYAGFPARTLP
jgi:thiamine pyrophosphate-dependent acetolactate synthase large subunit-like protein